MRGRKPKPTSLKLVDGNPGKRAINGAEPKPPAGKPTCPAHLSPTAKAEWKRIVGTLNEIGLLTRIDRTVLAAYCQAYARWAEAEEKLKETPPLLKTPSGYIQQSPRLAVANKQLELMGRFATELGLTPSARRRVDALKARDESETVDTIEFVVVYEQPDGSRLEESRQSMPMAGSRPPKPRGKTQIVLDGEVASKL